MEKLRKPIGKHLPAIVAIVLAMVAVVACRNEYYHVIMNFRIEKVYLTPITIDDFPADEANLYLLEVAFSPCPPDSFISDGKLRGIRAYSHGSIDTVTRVKFTNDGLIVHPKQLHWISSKNHYVQSIRHHFEIPKYSNLDIYDVWTSILEESSNKTLGVYYSSDYWMLSKLLMSISDEDIVPCRYDSSYYCSYSYLVAFDRNSPLPDNGNVEFKNRNIKIEIKDKPLKFKINGHIRHFIP